MNHEKNDGYNDSVIPTWLRGASAPIYANRNLVDRLVWFHLENVAEVNGEIDTSAAEIARLLRLSPSAVKRSIISLQRDGIITARHRYRNHSLLRLARFQARRAPASDAEARV